MTVPVIPHTELTPVTSPVNPLNELTTTGIAAESVITVVAVRPTARPGIALNGIIVSAIGMSYYVNGIPKTTTLKTVLFALVGVTRRRS